MANKYHIKIGEVELSLEGDAEYIEKERSIFFNGILPMAVDAMVNARAISQANKPPDSNIPMIDDGKRDYIPGSSVNEFLRKKGFSTQIDTALGLFFYFTFEKGVIDFSTEELKSFFHEAKIPIPLNPSDIISKLVGRGHVQPADQKGRYTLTNSGIDYVNSFLGNKKDKKTSSKPNRVHNKKESEYSNLSADDLNLKNYPEVKAQETFKKRMMLALFIIFTEGHGDTFSVVDVQYIMTNIFGLPATKDQVQGVFSRQRIWFKDIPDEKNTNIIKHKLLEGAKDFVKSYLEVP